MIGIQDYGDDGVVPMIESEEVADVVDAILEYVEARFEILDMQERYDDQMALAQEFWEWGAASVGDDISYYTCPNFE